MLSSKAFKNRFDFSLPAIQILKKIEHFLMHKPFAVTMAKGFVFKRALLPDIYHNH